MHKLGVEQQCRVHLMEEEEEGRGVLPRGNFGNRILGGFDPTKPNETRMPRVTHVLFFIYGNLPIFHHFSATLLSIQWIFFISQNSLLMIAFHAAVFVLITNVGLFGLARFNEDNIRQLRWKTETTCVLHAP